MAFLMKSKFPKPSFHGFVSFSQQPDVKRVAKQPFHEVADCQRLPVLYFGNRKRGGGSSVF
jgi:hypothetical protein